MKTLFLILFFAGTAFGQGVSRWPVKTLADNPKQPKPELHTIVELIALKAPAHWSEKLPRQPLETQTVTVKANLIGCFAELDSDYHLILSDGKNTMIGEIPLPKFGNSSYASKFQAARSWIVTHCGKPSHKKNFKPIAVTVTGFLFFDEPGHNGKGHAGNEIEIHPITQIQ